MNILLWILQVLLALWNLSGALFMMGHYQDLASVWASNALPQPVWIVIGVLQVFSSIGVVLPGARLRKATSIAATALAVLSLLGLALYTQYTGFPGMLWGAIPAFVAAVVAYQRWRPVPPAGQQRSVQS